jgi:hypothetical protein
MAYRARNELVASPPGPLAREPGRPYDADRQGLGWDGRVIVAGIAAVAGILPLIYSALTLYLWGLLARDVLVRWSAGHSAVDG